MLVYMADSVRSNQQSKKRTGVDEFFKLYTIERYYGIYNNKRKALDDAPHARVSFFSCIDSYSISFRRAARKCRPVLFIPVDNFYTMINQTQNTIIFDFMRTLYDPETGKHIAGANVLLKTLHKHHIPMYLVSYKEGHRTTLMDELGIRKYFTAVELVDNKRQAMESLKKDHAREHIWVVGDRVQEEIMEGNRIGATTVWFKQGHFAGEEPMVPEEKPDFTITELTQVLDLLDEHKS